MIEDDLPEGSTTALPVLPNNFYQGVIVKLRRGSRSGTVRSNQSGRDLPFTMPFVVIVGASEKFEDLKEGMRIGFDVSRDSHGPCVSVIRIAEV